MAESYPLGQAPWEKPITSPYGNNAADLAPPVPMSAAPVVVPEVDSFEVGSAPWEVSSAPAAPIVEAPSDMSALPAPTGVSSMQEQLNEVGARLKYAFTVTGKEAESALRDSGLFEDVRVVGNDKVQVKRAGRKGWENFDRDGFQASDIIDLARSAFEGVIEKGAMAAGAVTGTVAAPGLGTAAGAMAAGAAGSVAANNAGDFVAQKLMGIPRDPERGRWTENAIAAAFGAGFGVLDEKLARKGIERALRSSESKKTLEAASTAMQETMDDIRTVQESGIVLGERGTFRLDPQQSLGAQQIPEVEALARELSTEQSFRNMREKIAGSVTKAYDSVAKALGAQAGRGADVADDFVLTAKDVRDLEGKLIWSFRDQVDGQLKGMKLPTPRTLQTLQMVQQSIKSAGHAERQLGLTPSQAKNYIREMRVIESLMTRTKGQTRFDTARALEDRLTKQINSHINSANGRPYALAMIDMRNAVRDDAIDMMDMAFTQMGGGVPGGGQLSQMFAASKARYRQIMKDTDSLGKLLETENISRNELVGKLFEGKGSYKFAKSAKTLIQETNPKLWDKLAGEYFSKLRNDATDLASGSVDWKGMTKKWNNLDPRLQQDLLTSQGIPRPAMDSLMKLGIRIQHADFPYRPKDADMSIIKGTIKAAFNMFGGPTAKGNAITELLGGMGKNQSLAKWMQEGGVEEILKEMPGLKPTKAAMLREWAASWTPAPIQSVAKKTAAATKQTGKAAIRRDAEDEY